MTWTSNGRRTAWITDVARSSESRGAGYERNMEPNTAALFDIDGTLVDSTYHHALAWHRAFTRVGEAPALWRIHRSVGMGGDKLVAAAAGQDVEERHGDELRDAWREEYAKIRCRGPAAPGCRRPGPGAVGRRHPDRAGLLRRPGVRPRGGRPAGDRRLVEVLTTAEDVDGSKPEPDLIEVTLDRLGGVERAVFVGDTPYDVQAADRAGMGCIALLTGGFGSAELTGPGRRGWPSHPRSSSASTGSPPSRSCDGDATAPRREGPVGRCRSGSRPGSGVCSRVAP